MHSNEDIIETLPFDLAVFERNRGEKSVDVLIDELEKHRIKLLAVEKVRMRLFYQILDCGLGLGCGFIVHKHSMEIPFVVTRIDFVLYEIHARSMRGSDDEGVLQVVHSIENSFIDGIKGHLRTEMINKPE